MAQRRKKKKKKKKKGETDERRMRCGGSIENREISSCVRYYTHTQRLIDLRIKVIRWTHPHILETKLVSV